MSDRYRDRLLAAIEGRPIFRFVKAGEVEPKAPAWLVRGYLEEDALAVVFGDPGCGKSFLAVDLACCVATGRDYLGQPVKQGPVIYLASEGIKGLARRKSAWQRQKNDSQLDDAPFFVSDQALHLCDTIDVEEVQSAIDSECEGIGNPRLIVVDTLARNFGAGDENSTADMNKAVKALDQLRTPYGATVLVIHHTGHGDKSRGRGSMALKGALDAEYRMSLDNVSNIALLQAEKMKDSVRPSPVAFHLEEVGIGLYDDDYQEVTSAVLVETECSPSERRIKGIGGKHQTAAVRILKELVEQGRGATDGASSGSSDEGVPLSTWRKAIEASGVSRRRSYAIPKELHKAGYVRISDDIVIPL